MADVNALPFVESVVDLRDTQFVENQASWEPIIEAFHEASKAVTVEAQPGAQLKHQSRGQLLGKCFTVESVDNPNVQTQPETESPFFLIPALHSWNCVPMLAFASLEHRLAPTSYQASGAYGK